MRILTTNQIKNVSSISMTNPDVNYPVSRIYSNMLEEYAKADGGSASILMAWDDDIFIDCFFLGFHNLSSFELTLKDSGGSTLKTLSVTSPAATYREYFDEVSGVRSAELVMLSSAGDIIIGNAALGLYDEFEYKRSPIEIEYVDSSVFDQTDGGQMISNLGIQLQEFSINLVKQTQAQINTFKRAFSEVGQGAAFWFDEFEELDDHEPVWGGFISNYSTSKIDTWTALSVDFREAR